MITHTGGGDEYDNNEQVVHRPLVGKLQLVSLPQPKDYHFPKSDKLSESKYSGSKAYLVLNTVYLCVPPFWSVQ
jgi:hypothetical protein